MSTYIIPFFNLIMVIIGSLSAAWTIFNIIRAGIEIMGQGGDKKADGIARVKWIIIGAVASVSAFTLAGVAGLLATTLQGNATGVSGTFTQGGSGTQQLIQLPSNSQGSGIQGWVTGALMAALAFIFNTFAAMFWSISGMSGPAAMIQSNIATASNGNVMGIFSPVTWSAMLYVQHTLDFVVGIAAVIAFSIQGMRIQGAAPSIAKERATDLIRNVLLVAIVLGLTPMAMGLVTSGVSDLTMFILGEMQKHVQMVKNAGSLSYSQFIYSAQPTTVDNALKMSLFKDNDVANSLFNLVFSVVNLLSYLVYTWRRVMLAIFITIMPLFYIGLVTGRRQDLVIHWWKEFLSYMLIPFVSSLLLFIASVFIGM